VAAAAVDRRSVSEFVLDSALARAEEALALWWRFGLDAKKWKAFLHALDAAPRDLPRVKKLFSRPSVFEEAGRSDGASGREAVTAACP
jgi:uncharacterized protein (DUF1778 family)